MLVILNDVKIDAEVEKIDEKQKEFRINFAVIGENNYNLYSSLLKGNNLNVKIPSYGIDFKASISHYSRTYQGPLDEDTIINFSFIVKEKTDEGPEWNLFTGLYLTAINNWVRTRALAKILKEKGLLTDEEYEKVLDEIYESDFEEMKKFILEGK